MPACCATRSQESSTRSRRSAAIPAGPESSARDDVARSARSLRRGRRAPAATATAVPAATTSRLRPAAQRAGSQARGKRDGEDDRAAAVRAEAVPGHRHEARSGDPLRRRASRGAAEEDRAAEGRHEQHRLEEVREPVEAARSGSGRTARARRRSRPLRARRGRPPRSRRGRARPRGRSGVRARGAGRLRRPRAR